MGLEGPLEGFGEGNGSSAASMGAGAGGDLDTQLDLNTLLDQDTPQDPALHIGPSSWKLQQH